MRLIFSCFIIINIFLFSSLTFAQPNMHNDFSNNNAMNNQSLINQVLQDYNNANMLFFQQKYKDALKIYENIIEVYKEPRFIDNVKMRIAEIYEKLGDFENAIKIYNALLEKNPNDYRIKLAIANLYRWDKKFDQSIEMFKQIMPENDNYHELIGNIYLESGDHDKAISSWLKIIDKDPRSVLKYKRVAYIFYQSGLIAEGISVYLKARKIFNNPYLFSYELSELYEFQMEYKKAIDEYLSFLQKDPDQFENIQDRIIKLIIKEKTIYEYCINSINEILNKNPENSNMRLLLTYLLIKNQQVDTAIKEHEKILESNPNKKNILLFTFSEDLEKMGYKRKAIEIYQQIDVNYAGYELAQTKIIELLLDMGKNEEVIQKAQKFITTSPRQDYLETSLYYLGMAYFNLKNYSKSRESFNKITQINPGSNFYNYCLTKIADTYFREGNFEQAIKDDINILNISNSLSFHDYAYFMIAKSMSMLGKYDESLKKFQNFVKRYPESLYVNDALEEICFLSSDSGNNLGLKTFFNSHLLSLQGKENEAIRELESLIIANPKDDLAQFASFQIGKIYLENNHVNEAIIAFQTMQTKFPDSILASFAQEKIAYIYAQKIKDKNKAIEAFQKIIINYPGSILLSKARENIRKLERMEIPTMEQ